MDKLINDIYNFFPHALNMTKNKQDAEDLLQDLAEAVFKIPNYYIQKPVSERRAIFFTILKNMFINICIKQSKQDFSEYIPNYVENDAWGNLQKRDLQKALYDLQFLRFKNNKRGLEFKLKLEGYKIPEIADLTNSTTKKVYDSIARTRKYLTKNIAA